MSNMRVKMILDLVANTGKGAAQARKDLAGIKSAARGIKGGSGAGTDKLRRDMDRLAPSARRAARELAIIRARERQLGRADGIKQSAKQIDRARASAQRLSGELKASRRAMRDVEAASVRMARTMARERERAHVLAQRRAVREARHTGVALERARNGGKERRAAQAAGAQGGGAGLMAAGRGIMPMVGAYMGWQGVKAVSRNTVGKSISFESAMADVKRKVDLPDGGSFEQIEEWVNKAAIKFGKSRVEVANLVAELGAAGIGYNDLSKAIELNTKASVAWDMSAGETGNTMAKIRAGQNWTMAQLEEFGDKVNLVADAGASKESDVVEMFQRAGAAGLISGMDTDTSLAFLAGMNSAGIQPEIAARGFSAMISKLRVANTGGTDKMEEGFKRLGLTSDQVEGNMRRNGVKTLFDFIDRFKKSNDQAGVATLIFGQGWWDEWSRMVQAMPEIQKYLGLLGDSSNWRGSMQKSLNIELETTENHLARLEALTSKIGDNLGRWMLPGINDGVNRVVEVMDNLDEVLRRSKEAKDAGARANSGQEMTDAQARRFVEDDSFAGSVDQAAYEQRQRARNKHSQQIGKTIAANRDAPNQGERRRNQLRLDKDNEIEGLTRALNREDQSGSSPQFHAQRQRLAQLRRERDAMGPMWQETIVPPDPITVGFQEDRARLRKQVDNAERGMRTDPRAAPKFRKLAAEKRAALAKTDAQLRRYVAPDLTAIQTYGNADVWPMPTTERPGSIGSTGLTSFGLSGGVKPVSASWTDHRRGKRMVPVPGTGAKWANSVKSDFDEDIAPGITISIGDKIAESISASGGKVQAAAQAVASHVSTALSGVDMTAAGQWAATSFANGLLAGIPTVRGAAQRLTAAGTPGTGGGRISGALHDGVD